MKGFKEITGLEGRYAVSRDGKVWSFQKSNQKTGHFLIPSKDRYGYPKVCLRLDNKYLNRSIHRLVAETWLSPKEHKTQINHKNGNKQDNRVQNLEWCTPKENKKHAVKHGLVSPPKGEQHYAAKLTEEQVIEIRNMLLAKATPQESLKEVRCIEWLYLGY